MPTQRQRGISIVKILASDSDQREFQLLAQIHGVVAVLQLLHELAQRAEALVHTAPVDDARLDDIEKLEDDQTIGQIGVQPVHMRRHAHRVHPVAVGWKREKELISK